MLTGWDDNGGDGTTGGHWILRNSWGPSWGEEGYMRIGWGVNNIGETGTYMIYGSTDSGTGGAGGETNTGGDAGAEATGGANSGGDAGAEATGGANTGGDATGGATGGTNTGGNATGGATGGANTGGSATGGATGGANTGGATWTSTGATGGLVESTGGNGVAAEGPLTTASAGNTPASGGTGAVPSSIPATGSTLSETDAPATSSAEQDGGCGCRAAGSRDPRWPDAGFSALALIGLLWRRRSCRQRAA